jgi:hypothetical protein
MLEVMPRSKLFCLQDKFGHYRKQFRTIDRPMIYGKLKKLSNFEKLAPSLIWLRCNGYRFLIYGFTVMRTLYILARMVCVCAYFSDYDSVQRR